MNYSNQPNLLFIVYKSKKIDDNEITKPNIIIGLDFSLSLLTGLLFDKDIFLSLSLLTRVEKSLLTLKN